MNETCLVTGGAGSIGSALTKSLLLHFRAVRVFDNSEYNLFKLKESLQNHLRKDRLRLLYGDVRDRERVKLALRDVDMVYHLAAMKNIGITEYNMPEVVRTNIEGTINLVECCFQEKPETFIFVSSDKSVEPTLLYGLTKAVGERIILWANQVQDDTDFLITRFPNVIETSGNVFEIYEERLKRDLPLEVRGGPGMRRYFIRLGDVVSFLVGLKDKGRELRNRIVIPENYETKEILKIAEMMVGGDRSKIVFKPPVKGEKMIEKMWTSDEEKRIRRREGLIIIDPEY